MTVDFDRFARFYDGEYGAFDADLALYRGFAERAEGPILELGCGTGRVLLALAEAGFDVVGLDTSAAMIEIARAKAQALGVSDRVRLIQGDMRQFELDCHFGLIYCAINSFMHLETQADQLAALSCCHRHLLPDGLLVLDLFPPNVEDLANDDGRLIVQGTWQDPTSGATVIKQYTRQVDLAEQTIHVQFFYDEVFPDRTLRRTIAPFTMRYLGRYEAELLLEKAGFALEAIYGSWEMDPFVSESERMILVASPLS